MQMREKIARAVRSGVSHFSDLDKAEQTTEQLASDILHFILALPEISNPYRAGQEAVVDKAVGAFRDIMVGAYSAAATRGEIPCAQVPMLADIDAANLKAILRDAIRAIPISEADDGWRVPEGWKLVPEKPTEEMMNAFRCAWTDEYRDMLAAAPLPEEGVR